MVYQLSVARIDSSRLSGRGPGLSIYPAHHSICNNVHVVHLVVSVQHLQPGFSPCSHNCPCYEIGVRQIVSNLICVWRCLDLPSSFETASSLIRVFIPLYILVRWLIAACDVASPDHTGPCTRVLRRATSNPIPEGQVSEHFRRRWSNATFVIVRGPP